MDDNTIPAAAPQGADALTAPPQVPSKADMHGWYDAPTAVETVRGDLDPSRGDGRLQYESSTPDQEGAASGNPPSMLTSGREYQPLAIPEGGRLDEGSVKELQTILDSGHAGIYGHQDQAQKLFDLHHKLAGQVREEAGREQRRYWENVNQTWKNEARADPEMGGARFERSLTNARAIVDEYGGSHEQRAALMQQLEVTGLGNNPNLLRLLNNVAKKLTPIEDFSVTARTPANMGQRSSRPGSRGWYPNMNEG